MRRPLIVLWVLAGVALLAWHLGHGRDGLLADTAQRQRAEADRAAATGDWAAAAAGYGRSLDALAQQHAVADAGEAPATAVSDPAERTLILAQAHARARAGELLESSAQLDRLAESLPADADPALALAIHRERAANAYHTAWLMRLEGAAPDEWLPESEVARQQFRALAESEGGATAAADLESTVRLQRMDLTELQGLPLPKQCPNNCQNLSQRKRKQRESQNDKPGAGQQKPEKDDARKQIKQESRGADRRQRPEGGS